jgi:drug/metabolite transporter (DMT)-like permease
MSWIFYAFVCAILLSASSLIEKRVLLTIHAVDFSAAIALLDVVFSIPFLFLIDYSKIDVFAISLIFITATLASVAYVLVAKGIRHLEVSTVSPLLALSPGTTSILAFLILGERLEGHQIFGVLCMIVGSYILTTRAHESLAQPFKVFFNSKYIHYILLSLFFYSIGAIFDRAILHSFNISLVTYIFFFHFFIAILMVTTNSAIGGGIQGLRVAYKQGGVSLVAVALLTLGYRFFQMEALQIASVGLVSAIKRTSSFFTTFIGGELFHEKDVKRKIFAACIIIAGSLLVVL